MSNESRRLVHRCLESMYANLDAPLPIAELARSLGASESVLKRAFYRGDTRAADQLRELRYERSHHRLRKYAVQAAVGERGLRVGASNNRGVLYAPSIIDAWTTAHDQTTSLYWLLSTWNPYQVYLMKTDLLQ